MSEPSSRDLNHWVSGWSLSSRPESLFRATTNYLHAQLSDQVGKLYVRFHGMELNVHLPSSAQTTCQICACGLRLTGEADGHTAILSIYKLEPGILLIEADAQFHLQLEATGIPESTHGEVRIWTNEAHQLIHYAETGNTSTSHILVSGSGRVEPIISRARTLLQNAHGKLDAAFREQKGSADSRTATEHLLSRLRPASPAIPCPWLANQDEDPIWDMGSLFPVCEAFNLINPPVAAGLINNYLELMQANGELPVRGGNRIPLAFGTTTTPLLLQLSRRYHDTTNQWPFDLESTIERLDRYIERQFTVTDTSEIDPDAALFRHTLLMNECSQWENLQTHITGTRDSSKRTREIIRHAALPHHLEKCSPEWLNWLQGIASEKLKKQMVSTGNEPSAPMVIENFTGVTYSAKQVSALMLAQKRADENEDESEAVEKSIPGLADQYFSPRGSQPDNLAASGLKVRIESLNKTGTTDKAERNYPKMLIWMNRRRKWLAIACGVIILIIGGWLISVLTRETMPVSVFETKIGLALHHYRSGELTNAMAVVEEMEARGAGSHATLQIVKGKIFFKKGEYEEARLCFEYALKNRPGNPALEFNIGLTYFYQKNFTKAAEIFEASSRRFARNQPIYAMRAKRAGEISREFDRTYKHLN
ncbi:MAG TPA: hypothetical protein PJ991_12230 [Kiritimatiellia bacterium]|nr:hypothetical protein [Kiritimatiellia bacterium]